MYWYFEGKSTETEIEELKRWVEESEENAKEFHNQQILHDLMTINADVPSAQQVGNRKRNHCKHSKAYSGLLYSKTTP